MGPGGWAQLSHPWSDAPNDLIRESSGSSNQKNQCSLALPYISLHFPTDDSQKGFVSLFYFLFSLVFVAWTDFHTASPAGLVVHTTSDISLDCFSSGPKRHGTAATGNHRVIINFERPMIAESSNNWK